MLSDLFDSPWKVLILAIVILVLFGSKKLPDAARSLGKSMRILKTEIHDLHDENNEETTAAPTVASAPVGPAPAPAQIAHQNQVDSLQQQLDELRRQQQATVEAQQQTQQVS
jgi:sec-independent protein translocase protein TatA